MSSSLVLVGIVLASCAVIDAQFEGMFPKPGFVSPLIPSMDDIRLCRENANGRELKLAYKLPLQTCKPFCRYENETEQITAVNGQLCCDIVGVGPTGLCKDGTCLVGGMAGWNRKDGLKTIMD